MADSEPAPLDLAAVGRILARVEAVVREPGVVLVGGQAVSVWFGQLHDRLQTDFAHEQVFSRDIDFLGTATEVRRAADFLGGEARVASLDHHTPLAGVALFLRGG